MDDLQNRLQEIVESFRKVINLNNPYNLQPDFISHYKVSAYGTNMLIRDLASIAKIDNFTLEVKPFDKHLIKNIEQVLWNSKKGTVVNNKSCLLFQLPPITTSVIEGIVKSTKTLLETFKQKVKNARHDYLNEFKKQEKDKVNVSKESEAIQTYINQANDNLQEIFNNFQNKLIGNNK